MSTSRCEWRHSLTPTLDAIEQFCEKFQRWRLEHCQALDAFSSELLLREVLTNSVVHGGSSGSADPILCVLRIRRNRLVIAVSDQGEGFDWRHRWDHQAQISDPGGRGMEILRAYADRVRFNTKGNSVTLLKLFKGTNN